MADVIEEKQKGHQKPRAGNIYSIILLFSNYLTINFIGRKADKKKALKRSDEQEEQDARTRNPKAFAIQSVAKAQKRFHR